MKKLKNFLFVGLLAVSFPVWGQSSSAIAEYTVSCFSPKTIVRTWGNYAVSYVRESGSGYLYLTDITEMPVSVSPTVYGYLGTKLPLFSSDAEVDDIQILNDKVFFCGSYQGSVAIYGWVSLPFISSSQIHFYFVTNATKFKQMVVYKGMTSTKLVAIGEDYPAPPITYTKDVIVEIDDAESNSPSGSLYELPYNNDQRRECLYDIVLTDDYVVFFGHDTDADVSLCTRWASRNNISGTIQNRYDYTLPQDEVHSKLLATVVDSAEWIAISYVHVENGTDYTTRTRVIDVNMPHAIQYSQEYVIANKTYPYELSYNSTKMILTVLQNCVAPQGESKFRLLDPFATVDYLFNTLYYPDLEFTSLCQFDKNRYVATGTNNLLTSKFWYAQDLTSTLSSTMSCPYLFKEKASILTSPSVRFNPQNTGQNTLLIYYGGNPFPATQTVAPLICNIPSNK